MIRIALFALWLVAAGLGHVSAQTFQSLGSASLAVTVASGRVALPAGTSGGNITILNVGTDEAFINFGGSSVTAATTNESVPAGSGRCFAITSQTYVAAITAANTATLRISQGSGPCSLSYRGGSSTGVTAAAVLGNNQLVVGDGGARGIKTITTGANVLTALGVDVGSAGAFVVNGGALGTPSSGVATNLTSIPAGNLTGTISDNRLSTNVPLLNAANIFTAGQIYNINAAAAPANIGGSVQQLVGADTSVARWEADSFAAASSFSLRRADGTNAAKTALANADVIGGLDFFGYYVTGGPAYSGTQASFNCAATQAWTSTNQGTQCRIQTTPNGSTTLTTGLTIDQDQSVTAAGYLAGTNLKLTTGNIYPAANSTTALGVAQADGTTKFVTFDSTNKRVGINKTPGAFDLDVNGAVNFASTAAVSGALTLGNGSSGAPSINFGTANTGFYQNQASQFVAVVGAASVLKFEGANIGLQINNGYGIAFARGGNFANLDVYITPGSSAATLTIGNYAGGTPVAQTLGFENGSGTNIAAAAQATLVAPLGTGTGVNGDFVFKTGVKVGSGSGAPTQTTALTIKGETQHIKYGGGSPAVSACGTGSPSIDGNATDSSGTVTVGTVATGCTITFAKAYTTFNHCAVTSQGTISGLSYSYTLSVITIAASALGGDLIDYKCDGV